MNKNTISLIIMYVIIVALQQAFKGFIPIDSSVQLMLALYAPPIIWLVMMIIQNGHKY